MCVRVVVLVPYKRVLIETTVLWVGTEVFLESAGSQTGAAGESSPSPTWPDR